MHEGVVDVNRRLITGCMVLLAAFAAVWGGERNEKIMQDLSVSARKRLANFRTLSPQALDALD